MTNLGKIAVVVLVGMVLVSTQATAQDNSERNFAEKILYPQLVIIPVSIFAAKQPKYYGGMHIFIAFLTLGNPKLSATSHVGMFAVFYGYGWYHLNVGEDLEDAEKEQETAQGAEERTNAENKIDKLEKKIFWTNFIAWNLIFLPLYISSNDKSRLTTPGKKIDNYSKFTFNWLGKKNFALAYKFNF